jgi:glucose-6-phosphate-specific signal transduction histidine kinase
VPNLRRPEAGPALRGLGQRLWADDLALQAEEEERQRIADAIHDQSVQTVTAASLRLQPFRRILQEPSQQAQVTALEELLETTSAGLRQLMLELHPPALDGSGVAAAIRETLEPLRIEQGILFRVDSRIVREPPAGRRIAIFRTVEPLLSEAGARSVRTISVDLEDSRGGWLVVVSHEGGDASPESFGTGPAWARATLRSRLSGGWTRLETTPEGGVRISCWIPALKAGPLDAPSLGGAA